MLIFCISICNILCSIAVYRCVRYYVFSSVDFYDICSMISIIKLQQRIIILQHRIIYLQQKIIEL